MRHSEICNSMWRRPRVQGYVEDETTRDASSEVVFFRFANGFSQELRSISDL